MARILYGVSGEGSGHSSRAREMMSHLQAGGHIVKCASYDRGYRNLQADFDVLEIEGLHIAAAENQVSLVETFVDNLRRLPDGVRALRRLRRLFDEFEPDCVITDFEPMTAYLADRHDLPLITLDNQHRIRYMKYSCPRRLRKNALITETVIRAIVPRPDVSLVTTFYFGDVKNDRTLLFPPILRQEVRERTPSHGDHVLVYFTQGFESFLDRLRASSRERFHIYGMGEERVDGNLLFRPFSSAGFLDELAACKAVIATAGFTLITESLHLGKPYLALPMEGQFEQELNASMLEELGFGRDGSAVAEETLGDFLYRLPEYRDNLRGYRRSDNSDLQATLDDLLAGGCARAREYHRRRAN